MSGFSLAKRSLGLSRELGRELGMVLPRTVAGLNESTGWVPASPRGVRQFGEVMLDELVLSGFSLLGGNLTKDVRPLSACAPAAEQLSALAPQVLQSDPFAPHSDRVVGCVQRVGVQQPAQLVAVQLQLAPTHCRPAAQEVPEPHEQYPKESQ